MHAKRYSIVWVDYWQDPVQLGKDGMCTHYAHVGVSSAGIRLGLRVHLGGAYTVERVVNARRYHAK